MSVNRRFSVGMAWMFAGNWIEQAINFAVFVALARLLGVEAFGLAAMAAAFVILAEFLVRETLTEPLIARDELSPGHLDAAFLALAALSAATAGGIALAAGPIAALYGEPEVAPLLRGLCPAVLIVGLGAVPVAVLRREMRFDVLSRRAVAGVLCGGAAGLGMALAGFGVWSLVGQRLAQVGANALWAWAAAGWRPGRAARPDHFDDLAGFGAKVVGLRAAELASAQAPSVIIGALLGAEALGRFAVALRLVEVAALLLVAPVQAVAQPAFAALRRAGGEAGALLARIAEISSLVGFSAFAGLAVLAGPATTALLGPEWAEAAPVLQALCLAGGYLCVEKVQTAFCLAAGRAGGLMAIAWAEAALGAAAIAILAPHGPAAAALAFAGRWLLLWPLRFRLVARAGGPPPRRYLEIFAASLAAAAVAALTLELFLRHAAAGLSPGAVIGFGTLIGAGVLLAVLAVALPGRLRTLRSLASGR